MTIPVYPQELDQVDYAQVVFRLIFQEGCRLEMPHLLGLRSVLNAAARQHFGALGGDGRQRYRALFEPDVGKDPVALRKFQKPAPPFVLQVEPFDPRDVQAGDEVLLRILFFGASIPWVGDFTAIMTILGHSGLVDGQGCFEVSEVFAIGEDGMSQELWTGPTAPGTLAPPLTALGPWLERQKFFPGQLVLQFDTPTRLMSRGRLLRRPDFRQIFPFMLRRVTSMLYTHAACEPWLDAEAVLRSASQVVLERRAFSWQDWRPLEGHRSLSQVGGFTGRLQLGGEALEEMFWILAVASLLGIGKGATFGAGRFRLCMPDAGDVS